MYADHETSQGEGACWSRVYCKLSKFKSKLKIIIRPIHWHYLQYQVGPIPIDDGTGKEVVTQIATTMATNKTFYTDSNGRDFIKRVH